jgi:hypothetical protein
MWRRPHMSIDADAMTNETTLAMRELDVDGVLGAAIDTAARNESGVQVVCAGIGDHAALVVGDRDGLARAFERLLSVAVRSSRRGATVTVALRREERAWSIHVEHPVRSDLDPMVGADCRIRLASVGAVLHAHRGSYRAAIQSGVRTLVVTLPEAL